MRRDRQDHLGRDGILGGRGEELSQQRNIAEQRHGGPGLPILILDQAGEDHGLIVLDVQDRFRCTGTESELLDFGAGLQRHLIPQPGDFDLELEREFINQVHGGLHSQLDSGVLELNGRNGGGRRHRPRCGLPRQDIRGREKNGLFVADIDRSGFVVDDPDLGRRQRLRIGFLFEEIQ